MAAKFVVKAGGVGQYFFNLMSDDGKKLLTGGMSATKANVFNRIADVKQYARESVRYEKVTTSDGRISFRLSNTSNEILGASEVYDSIDARDAALLKVMNTSADAAIVEESAQKKTRAEVTNTIEAKKLNKRTMRPLSPDSVVIRLGAILQQVKEDDRRLLFEYMGDPYEADLNRFKSAIKMI
jgi:uncharacterized protein